MHRMTLYFFAALLLFVLLSPNSVAQAPPSADTYVSSVTPKTNYGASPILVVQNGTTAFIQFNLSGLPTGASVNKATLRLYVDGVLASGSFDVFPVNGAWSESTLTYNTPPPTLGASATGNKSIAIASSSFNKFVLVDITSLVQGWVNGTTVNNGVALALTTTSGIFSFDGKESLLTGNGPELEIVLGGLVGPPGQQGIQGIQGAKGDKGDVGPVGATGAQGQTGPQGATGAQGPQGPNGLTGATGPQGTTGPQGPIGLTGLQGPQGPAGPVLPNLVYVDRSNTFAAAQTIGGNLALTGSGSGIQFPDGTLQTTAATGGAGIPSGFMILSSSPVAPAGYTLSGALVSQSDAWLTRAPMPTARDALAAVGLNGKIYAIGGYGNGFLNTVEVYDPSSNSWGAAASMPTARNSLAAVALNGKIYAIGGYGNGFLNTVEVYDPSSNSWTGVASMPTARNALAAVVLNGMIYAIGGYGTGYLNTVEVYNPSSDSWSAAASMPTARNSLAAVALNGKIYAIGGYDNDYLSTVEVFDPISKSWSAAASMPAARSGLAADAPNGKIYAIGGSSYGVKLNTIGVYDPSSNSWGAAASMPTARASLGAADVNGSIFAVGGSDSTNSYLTATEQYAPGGGTLYTFTKN